MPLQPTVLWAQRADRLLLTIDLQACKDPQISIINDEAAKAGKLTFRGNAHSHATGPEEHAYQLDLEFYGEVDDQDIKQHATERFITLVIPKKGAEEHWPRLLKAAGKPAPNIKVDWDKWVDEDEDEGDKDPGFDLSALQNFQNFGAGGMAEMARAMGGMGGGMGGGLGDMARMMGGMGGGMGDASGMMGGMGSGLGDMARMRAMAGMGGTGPKGDMPRMSGLGGTGGDAGMAGKSFTLQGGMGGFGDDLSDEDEEGEGTGEKGGAESDDDMPALEPVPQQ